MPTPISPTVRRRISPRSPKSGYLPSGTLPEFGSGFKIAMRDLEIRGAGNLLGAEQSGHMSSVGYDMYLKLLDEAVLEEKGEAPRHRNAPPT